MNMMRFLHTEFQGGSESLEAGFRRFSSLAGIVDRSWLVIYREDQGVPWTREHS
jgi:hypothetical protein